MDGPVITTELGKLRGAILESVAGGSYLSFKGIPYAAPPIGELRFKDPQPPKPWSGIRDASDHAGDVCLQYNEVAPFELLGGDDCLYLNVYTTSISEVRPVMVWIHGGGFVNGSGNASFYGPDYLVSKDVVLVYINYRLGVLGFLDLDNEVAPGNQGLKDQVAALRWVKKNISSFGGDPNNVTIFGESAGSASVHYLTVSPLAKGLFHKAIAQSGSATNPWACQQSYPKRAYRLASLLGKETSDPREVVEFLRKVPVDKLLEAQTKVLTKIEIMFVGFPFGPNVDDKSDEPFLPRPIHEMLDEGVDVPMVLGYTSHEGILFLQDDSEATFKIYEQFFKDNVKQNTSLKDPQKLPEVVRELKRFYFGEEPITKKVEGALIDFLSDLHFVHGISQLVNNRVKKTSPTYYYRYSFVGDESTVTKVLKQDQNIKVTSHADELTYFHYMPKFKSGNKAPPAHGTRDWMVMERFWRMWTDFAKTGNPTPEVDEMIPIIWEPISESSLNCLAIDEDLRLLQDPDAERRAAWQNISQYCK